MLTQALNRRSKGCPSLSSCNKTQEGRRSAVNSWGAYTGTQRADHKINGLAAAARWRRAASHVSETQQRLSSTLRLCPTWESRLVIGPGA